MKARRRILGIILVLTTVFLSAFSSCQHPLISDVSYEIAANLESIKFRLNFAPGVTTDIGGTFPVKDYGTIEVEPSTPETPFNVGFRLNTSIFNDQELLDLAPVTILPSGQPLPVALNRAMAQVKLKNEVDPNFDVYLYVDVLQREWLGLALTLKFINTKAFPPGLAVTRDFLQKNGRAQAVGAAFGPRVDNQGKLVVPGGIAVFANVQELLSDARKTKILNGTDSAGGPFVFYGPDALHYSNSPEEAQYLQEFFKQALSGRTPSRKGN
ncbi:MAG: hypothetical protein AB1540_12380 [Bdellovibrionota bacterium]